MKKTNDASILLVDIETAPGKGWFFDFKKEYNIIEVEQQPFLLSVAWKWLGEDTIHCKALPDFRKKKLYTDEDDYELCGFIHSLFSQADVIVAHNGIKFDTKFVNARLLKHRFSPPSPFKNADTLLMHRSVANVPSHRLDYLARFYNIGAKLPNAGKDTWLGCVRGDADSWSLMKRYNKHDVYLLEKLYLLIRGWSKTHPNLSLISRKPDACPRCQSTLFKKDGHEYNRTSEAQRYECLNCGKQWKGDWEKLSGAPIPANT